MKSRLIKVGLFTSLIFLLFIVISGSAITSKQPKVKNIILLIGDGMGLAQVYSAISVSDHPLNIERAQYIGLSKTYSANNYVTDSGAGGTAISTGSKTNNGAIAVDSAGNKLKTILEYAEDAGKSTGIVVTCNLNHATPASFVAHETVRYMDVEITRDFLKTEVDVLIGGGASIFDSLGVSSALEKKGYRVYYNIDSIDVKEKGNIACFAASDYINPILKGRGDFLPKAVNIALDKLSKNQEGFFLMVEGSQIDWGGHCNNIDYVTSELIDFDKAVGLAMDFADKNPGTLVIITADHETGGLTLTGGDIKTKEITAQFLTTDHSGVMVPIYTYGTGSEAFSGIMQNTGIFSRMMQAFGFNK
jgi:alkaline phosphatase